VDRRPLGPNNGDETLTDTTLTTSSLEALLIEQRIANDGPNTIVAYAAFILLGPFGGHRFYLGSWQSGLIMLLLTLLGLALSGAVIGIPLVLASLVWCVIDGFFWLEPTLRRRRADLRKALGSAV
jgi:TM2 domain-containing membrane protein YozV